MLDCQERIADVTEAPVEVARMRPRLFKGRDCETEARSLIVRG